MVKVIIVSYDNNPSIGSEGSVAYLWSEIISNSYETVVYTQNKHRVDLEKLNSSLNFRYVEQPPFPSKILQKLKLYNYDYVLFIHRVERMIKRDIVNQKTIIHFLTPAGIHSYTNLGKKLSIPYIVGPIGGFLKMPNGFSEYRKLEMKLKEFLYSRIIKRKKWKNYFLHATRIISGTELVIRHLPEECKQKTSIIFDAIVDIDYFKSTERIRNSTTVKIIYSGRMVLYKGCFILLYAFEHLLKNGYDAIELIYAGDGSEKANLERYVSDHMLNDRVKVLGRVNRSELKELLNDSDIYCLPTLKDPGGISILEAMACGLPVISTNYGGPAYSVSKESGILIDPLGVKDYVEKLSVVLEKLINDKDLRERMGEKAREHVESYYSTSSLQYKVKDVYESVMKQLNLSAES
jgi:glycosyltransferase involved in cell wall biosynthesis